MKDLKQKQLTALLFSIYIIAVIWIILFKAQISFKALPHIRSLNLIPFAGSVIINGRLDFGEIADNIMIFIPFGIYLQMLRPDWSLFKKVMVPFRVSLILESLQYVLAIGATDITDLLGNTFGGLIGIGLYYAFSKLFKEKSFKIMNFLALAGTGAAIILIGFILFVNM